ncbi:MAG: acyl carrier protein [Terriglobales bacterium]
MDEKIMAVIADNCDAEEADRSLILGDVCDSLDLVNIAWELEEELDCDLDEEEFGKFLDGKRTVGELVDHVCKIVNQK